MISIRWIVGQLEYPVYTWQKFTVLANFKFQLHYVKSVGVRSYSGAHFPAFRLNTERYGVSLRIQSECGKMRTRITPNTETFYAVLSSKMNN